jgi:hypothetical protein
MNFEERLLAELKAEAAARAARGRARRSRRVIRLLAAGTIGAACTLAALLAPAVTGSPPAAYAVARNADGSITVTIKELRDPDRLEKELAANGARTDITYLPQRKRCAGPDRGKSVDPDPPPGLPKKKLREWIRRNAPTMTSALAFRWPEPRKAPNVFEIDPRYIKPGQTLVIELAESHTTKLWKLGDYVVTGPVRPCLFENDPYWH